IGFNFVPQMDSGQLLASLTMPAGTSLQRTNEIASAVEEHLRRDPSTELVQVQVGAGSLLGEANSSSASFILELVGKDARELSTDELALELRDQLTGVLSAYPEAEISIGNASEAFVGGVSTGFSLALSSTDFELLQERTAAAAAVLEDLPGLVNVESNLADATTERVLTVDAADL